MTRIAYNHEREFHRATPATLAKQAEAKAGLAELFGMNIKRVIASCANGKQVYEHHVPVLIKPKHRQIGGVK